MARRGKAARAAFLALLALLALSAAPAHPQTLNTRPCRNDGGSDICRCSDTIVNCDFTSYTRIPFGLPEDVTSLSMYSSQVKAVSYSSFTTPFILDEIVTLNLRGNVITSITSSGLSVLTRLQTLNLADNSLADLPNEAFASQTQLRVLNLADNNLLSLRADVFSTLTSLEELYLQGNRLTSLPRNVFSSLENLRILRLDGNSLTTIDDGVFDALTQLEQLHLAVNSIHTINPGTFDNLASLSKLYMLGNPSSCEITGGNVECLCNFGYGSDDGTYCTPKDCGPTIPDLNPLATADCSASTIYGGQPCVASCNPGYSDNTAEFVCSADGEWVGSIDCPAVDCGTIVPNLPANAVANCDGDTRFNGDPCMVSCETGYSIFNSRDDAVPITCGADGEWAGQQQIICLLVDCGRGISNIDPNAASVRCSPSTFGSTCEATCQSGYDGGPATFTCSAQGEWDGSLTCVGKECGREIPDALLPAKTFARCRGDSSFGGDNCQATCIDGWEGFPTTYRCSRNGVWQQISASSNCKRITCPTTIPNLNPAFRQASCAGTNEFESTCMATCQPGYVGPASPFTCQADKTWGGNYTDACTPIDCGPTIHNADALNVTATCTGDTRYTGDACTATCAPGYRGPSSTFTCGADGKWTGSPQCEPIQCGRPALLDSNVRLRCFDTVALGRGCRTSCAVGRKEGTDFTCNADGQWEGFVTCILPPTQNTTTTTTTSTTTTSTTTTRPAASTASALEGGTLIGLIIGVIAFLLLLVVVVLALRLRSNRTRPINGPPGMTKGPGVAETSMYTNPTHSSFRNRKLPEDHYSVYARAAMTSQPPRPSAPKPIGAESSTDYDAMRQTSFRKLEPGLDVTT